jgi:hypothetical protein
MCQIHSNMKLTYFKDGANETTIYYTGVPKKRTAGALRCRRDYRKREKNV